jgi:hypothetical protein
MTLVDYQTRLRTDYLIRLMITKVPDPNAPIEFARVNEMAWRDQEYIDLILDLDPDIETLIFIQQRNLEWSEYWSRRHLFKERYQDLAQDIREMKKENGAKADAILRKRGVIALKPN